MEDYANNENIPKTVTLSLHESVTVEENVQLELSKFQNKMVYGGWVLSVFIGLFILLALYDEFNFSKLITWYAVLMCANTLNVYIAYKNRHVTPKQTQNWRTALREYHLILVILCLTWGFLSILYTSNNMHFQAYIIAWLQLCIIGFSFGAITDYTACVIANVCILLPYVASQVYLGLYAILTLGHDPHLNISLSLIPIVLSAFSLMACYFGYRLIKNFFKLNFENIILSKKLEDSNKFLEERVGERTTELKNSLKLVTFQATHDLLTNLPNQRLLIEYAQHAIDSAREHKHFFAIVSLSLNEIEKINDSLGHETGNLIIKAVANRFASALKKNSKLALQNVNYILTLSRKDELVILIERVENNEDIEVNVEYLFSILNEPVYIDKQAIKLTASVGVSIYPRDGTDVRSLLMNADAAMVSAKQQGGNNVNIYKSEINANVYKKLVIENQLFRALENEEFTIFYQPFIDSKTKLIRGAEALARWNNPVLGYISPEEFIPIAEANGIIVPLGEWVFRNACQQAKIWHDTGFDSLKIAINLSAKQLQQKNIFEVLKNIAQKIAVNTTLIELELTETEAFREDTIPVLKQLKALGFNLSIDDFGTGYSGLSNLKLFSIDKLKIDKSFVRDLATNNDSKAIVANTIDLAKKIHVKVIAEGVETLEQFIFLREHDCELIQGYFFSPPIDAKTFTELLKNKNPFA
jgi:diguanylate cyclase (GGDEF)-like protein